ncbi:MAG: hypothetical protein ABI441_03140 [Flavobacterium sp.]
MKNLLSTLFLITICSITTYSQSKKDKYDAINAYLTTLLIDKSQTIIIVREKISANQTLKLFAEGKLNDKPFNRINGIQVREAGILEPLYDETDFQKMRKDYQDDKNDGSYGFSKDASWNRLDFQYKSIFFESFNIIMAKREKDLSVYKYHTQLIALSDPMFYKGKECLVIGVAVGDSGPLGYLNHYVIVMKKINKKWELIQRGEKYWFN